MRPTLNDDPNENDMPPALVIEKPAMWSGTRVCHYSSRPVIPKSSHPFVTVGFEPLEFQAEEGIALLVVNLLGSD